MDLDMTPVSKIELKKNRIRAFFHTLETEKKEKGEISEELQKVEKEGMEYIQLKLPVERITDEFENNLRNKIENKIIRANIREAEEKDLDIIKDIYNQAWLTSNTPFRPIDVDTLDKIFKDPDTIFLIGKIYGRDAAFAILDFEGPNKEYAIFAGLGVIPKFQRKGLGTIVGMACWNFIKENHPHVKELRAEVYKNNEVSYGFIKGLGFEEFGVKRYRKEDFED
ncbi:MAG: hypothetical protein BAJALOKI3v1_110056 [Promethearchaeota archaeon]|nr:MAG: hypothetical protein BAJALOKI3v1_110056 [Candidatus Lokiarchaeota archaeon]